MRVLKFITGQVIYNPGYTYKFHLKTTLAVIESWKVCQENFLKKDLHQEQEKIIYVVTPTYSKFEQVAQLTRFQEFIRSNSFKLHAHQLGIIL